MMEAERHAKVKFSHIYRRSHDSSSWVGVTKAPFVNFSVSKIFDLAKVPATFFESHSYLTGVVTYERGIQHVQ